MQIAIWGLSSDAQGLSQDAQRNHLARVEARSCRAGPSTLPHPTQPYSTYGYLGVRQAHRGAGQGGAFNFHPMPAYCNRKSQGKPRQSPAPWMPPAGGLMATEPAVMQMINVSSVEGWGPQEIGVDEFKRETPCLNRTTLENKYCRS